MNMESIVGKVIAGTTADTGEYVAWIVSEDHVPSLQDVARLFRRYNGKQVRLTIEEVNA